MSGHVPSVWRCDKGFWKVRCGCKWFVGELFTCPEDALKFWADGHATEVLAAGGR